MLKNRPLLTLATLALLVAAQAGAQNLNPAQTAMKAAIDKEMVDGDLRGAIALYEKTVAEAGGDRGTAAKALIRMAECHQKLGNTEALKVYERVLREYADQKEATVLARARLQSRANPNPDGLIARRVWTNQLRFAEGFVSPDGRYLTWVNHRAGGHLAIHDLMTGGDQDLTHGPEGSFASSPVFTPDGKRILYQWYDSGEDNWSIRLINLDGTAPRVVAKMSGSPGSVAPDGKTAAVILRQNGAQQLALLDLSSGKTTVLKSVEWRTPGIGNFSPDGKYIIYTLLAEQGSEDRDVFALSVDGSSEFRLVAAPGANRGAYFSPDGSHATFVSNRSGRWDLWTIGVAGGKPQGPPVLLKADTGPVTNIGFSRDGRFFFREQVNETDAYVAEIDPKSRVMRGKPRRLAERFVGSSAAPTWSADGKQLAYVVHRVRAGQYQPSDVTFFVANADGTQQREHNTSFPAATFAGFSRWFPNGSSMLLAQWNMSPRRRQFRRLDLQTGKIEPLFNATFSNNLNTAISPDGSAVYYAAPDSDDPRIKRLIRRELGTGAETSVYARKVDGGGPAALHGSALSPDQQQLAYFAGRTEGTKFLGWNIWIDGLAGGSLRQLEHPTGKAIIPNQMAWAPDGRGLFLIAGSGNNYFDDPQEIWYVPADGGKPHKTDISAPILDSLSIHPEGDRIGFTGGTTTNHTWMLETVSPARRAGK